MTSRDEARRLACSMVLTVVLVGCASAGSQPVASGPAPTTASATVGPSATAPADAATAWIAYQCETDKTSCPLDGIRLVRPDGTGDHALLAGGPLHAFHPDWSHDGMWLTYALDDQDTRDIWVARWDGSQARRVFDCMAPCVDADGPAFSPDDRSIAFRTFDQVDGQFPGSRLLVLDVATGSTTIVGTTTAPDYIGNGTGVRWSPDGGSIAMDIATLADAGATNESVLRLAIAVVDVHDAAHRIRTIIANGTFPSYVDWHPTRDLIVFMAPPQPGHPPFNLFTVHSDGTELTQITHFGAGADVWGPTWVPDGSTILVTVLQPQWTLGWIEPSDGRLTSINGPIPGAHPRQRPLP